MRTVTTVMELVGVAAIVTGSALTDWRLGLVVAGALLVALSYLLTAGRGRR